MRQVAEKTNKLDRGQNEVSTKNEVNGTRSIQLSLTPELTFFAHSITK